MTEHISQRLFHALLDILHNSPYQSFENERLALQLLAWQKLSDQENNPSWMTPRQAQEKNGPYADTVEDALRQLASPPASGDQEAAFRDVKARDLGDSVARNVLTLLTSTPASAIDYKSAVEAFAETRSGQETLAWVPIQVADLAVELAQIDESSTVYIPFEGAHRFASKANLRTRAVYVESRVQPQLAHLLNILLDGSVQVATGDPIRRPGWTEGAGLRQFDITIASLTAGLRYSDDAIADIYNRFRGAALYGEALQIRHILAQTKHRAIVLTANGLLFRTAAGERYLKEDLLHKGLLEAVIALPAGLMTTTQIPYSLMILDKTRINESVLFIDASSEHYCEPRSKRGSLNTGRNILKNTEAIIQMVQSRSGEHACLVSVDECKANDYNLLATRYVKTDLHRRLEQAFAEQQVATLEKVAEIIRPSAQDLRPSDPAAHAMPVIDVGEVGAVDIADDGTIHSAQKVLEVPERGFERLTSQGAFLRKGDIVLAAKGSVGKIGFVADTPEMQLVPGQSYVIIRPRQSTQGSILPEVLYRYLASPIAQELIQSHAGGVGVRMLQARDLKGLKVIVPTAEQQQQILETHQQIQALHADIAQKKTEVEALHNGLWGL